jgi:DNA-binding CsgD family transcriptional regulator
MALVAADYPNLRAALAWSRARCDDEAMARLSAALVVFWYFHGPSQEGEGWLDAALEHRASVPEVVQARTLCARCLLASGNFDVGTILAWSDEGLAVARGVRLDGLVSRILAVRGMAAILSGQTDHELDAAIALAREAGDIFALATAQSFFGIGQLMHDPPQARPYLEESVRVAEATGNRASATTSMANLGCALWWQGELRQVSTVLDEVAIRAGQSNDRVSHSMSLFYGAMALIEMDEREEALAMADRLCATGRESGMRLWDTYVPMARSQVSLARGEGPDALGQATTALQLAFVPVSQANILPALIEAELAAGKHDDAQAHIAQLLELSQVAKFSYYLAWSLVLKARLLRLKGESRSAEAAAHEGLAVAEDIESKTRIVDALELLAGVAVDDGNLQQACHLLAATRRIRGDTGYARCVTERDADLHNLRAAVGDDAFRKAYEEGHLLALEEAIAYARRGRGERRRPDSGWASLTPAEVKVAELVKDGLSNPDIGKRLLCSARTVQAHLTHIYAKLGVASRTELAADAARQQT